MRPARAGLIRFLGAKQMRNVLIIMTMLATALVTVSIAQNPDKEQDAKALVSRALDSLHEAAAKADGERYFSLFAPDAVFLGTDASERWPIAEFKAYAMKRFESGAGWSYAVKDGQRFITVSPDGAIAWFDELLENSHYGTCRGSGVLRRIEGQWKIAQYNLSIPIPNDLAAKVVGLIREKEKRNP
jgi:hypothetical protein